MNFRDDKKSITLAGEFMDCCWNDKDLNSLDQIIHTETQIESPVSFSAGCDFFLNIMQMWFRAFPDIRYKQKNITYHEGKIFIEWECRGRHLGEFYSVAATGKPIIYSGQTQLSFIDGQLLTYHADVDVKQIIDQITVPGFVLPERKKTVDSPYNIVKQIIDVHLSKRQVECISLAMLHMSAKEMAKILGIESNSVNTHLKRAYALLDVANRHGLVDYAIANNLIEFLLRIGITLRKNYGIRRTF